MKKLFLIIALVFLFSCVKNAGKNENKVNVPKSLSSGEKERRSELVLSPVEYIKWVNNSENNLMFSKAIEGIHFSVLCKPADYIVCKEIRRDKITSLEQSNIKSQLGDLQYFDLRITIDDFKSEFLKYNLSSITEYEKRVDYCAFQMQNDIKLVSGTDTIPCSIFHFERTFDVVPYGEFVLGFEKPIHSATEETFVVYDKLFNKGTIKFTFDASNLIYLPKLSTI